MKLFVVKVVNGNINVVSEWTDNEQGAKVSFHDTCKVLWNTPDVYKATVRILTDQMDCYQGYTETIVHPEPEAEAAE